MTSEIKTSFDGYPLDKKGHNIILSEGEEPTIFCCKCGYADTIDASLPTHRRIAYQLYQVGEMDQCEVRGNNSVFDDILGPYIGQVADRSTRQLLKRDIEDIIPDNLQVEKVAFES